MGGPQQHPAQLGLHPSTATCRFHICAQALLLPGLRSSSVKWLCHFPDPLWACHRRKGPGEPQGPVGGDRKPERGPCSVCSTCGQSLWGPSPPGPKWRVGTPVSPLSLRTTYCWKEAQGGEGTMDRRQDPLVTLKTQV